MPTFTYIAVDSSGKESKGTVEAANPNEAGDQVRKMGLFPTTINQAAGGGAAKSGFKFNLSFGGKSVSGKILTVFTRQLATLIGAGVPLLRSLKTLQRQQKKPALKNALGELVVGVESGSTFSDSLAQHPKMFNKLYINMVKAGEIGGVLEVVLARLAEFQEKAQKIRGKIISAMTYPFIVLLIAAGILIFLLTYIVPQFRKIFEDMLGGKALPWLTQFVIDSSDAFIWSCWPPLYEGWEGFMVPMLPIIVGVLVIGYWTLSSTEWGTAILDRIKLKLPIFGDLLIKTAIARFTRTLGTLVASGVPILQALSITKETAGNLVVSAAIGQVHERVKEGESMVTPLEQSGIFPPMVVSMIQVGEETGNLPDMLTKVADLYEEEVDNAVEALTSLLEPIMIVFLAVVVGTIVIALFLPLVSIIQDLSAGA